MASKEVTEIIGHIRNAGFRVSKSGNQKHWKVMHKNGSAVIDANGPLIISSSPSEHRFREMTVKRLVGAGVLKSDPYKETRREHGNGNGSEPTRGRGKLTDPAVQEAKLRAIAARSKEFHERTSKVRARLEPIIARLGGWGEGHSRQEGSGVTSGEISRVAMHWARTRGVIERPMTKDGQEVTVPAAEQAFRILKNPSGTLGDKWIPFVERFVGELESNAGTPPRPEKAAERYLELLRETKGIVAAPPFQATGRVHVSRPEVVPPPPEPVEHAEVGPAHTPQAPSIAMQAVFLMSKGAAPEDMDKIVELGEKIHKLEMRTT